MSETNPEAIREGIGYLMFAIDNDLNAAYEVASTYETAQDFNRLLSGIAVGMSLLANVGGGDLGALMRRELERIAAFMVVPDADPESQ